MKKITFLSFLLSFVFATQANAQLNEGFDTADLPTGWTTSSGIWVSGATANGDSSVAPRTGAGMALFKTITTGATSTLATPSQDLTSFTNPMLTFYYTSVNWYGDIDDLSVYYKDSASGTWTLIQTYTDEVTDWLKVELILPNPSDDYFIGFEGDSDWARGITLDDVSISEAPSCTPPTALSAASITATSAEISWTSDDSSFNVEVVDVTAGGTATGTATNTGVTSPYPLTGLSSNNEYEVYVQKDCGSGETSDWNSVSFSTLNSASCGETVTYTQVANGDYSIILTGGNPAMVTVNGNLETSWSGGCYDNIYVRDGSGNLINTVQSCGIFEDVTYTSTDGTISVQITNDSSTQNGDISLQFACETPSCIKPTDLAVSDVTTDGATIAWTSDGTLFNIEYGPAGFTQGNGTSDTSATASYELTGLNSGSTYDVYVQTDCGVTDGTSVWSSTSVSTLVTNDSCDTATVLDALPFTSNGDATAATNNNGMIDNVCSTNGMNDGVWYTFTPTVSGIIDLVIDPTGWDPEIAVYTGSCGVFTCVDRADSGSSGVSESLSISVTAGTQYFVNLGYWSDSSDSSEGVYVFRASSTDASLGIEEASMAQFTYFPNPVNDVLTIKAQKVVEDITVFNMLGQVVKQQTPNTMDCTVDLSAMQSGAYFVKVSIGNNVETVRILKK